MKPHYALSHSPQVRAERDHREVMVLLVKRNPAKCPVRPWLGASTAKRALCPNTGLQYGDCCGLLPAEKAAAKERKQWLDNWQRQQQQRSHAQ